MTSGPMSSGAAFVVPRWMPGWAGDPLSLLAQNLGVRTAVTPGWVMPTAWRPHTLTARINQQIVQPGYPGETTQCALTKKLRGLPPMSTW